MGRVAANEGIKISPNALLWIAEAGDGSMRDAQSIFDQVISYAGMDIKDDDVEESLGLADRKYLFRLSEAVLQARCRRLPNYSRRSISGRHRHEAFLSNTVETF